MSLAITEEQSPSTEEPLESNINTCEDKDKDEDRTILLSKAPLLQTGIPMSMNIGNSTDQSGNSTGQSGNSTGAGADLSSSSTSIAVSTGMKRINSSSSISSLSGASTMSDTQGGIDSLPDLVALGLETINARMPSSMKLPEREILNQCDKWLHPLCGTWQEQLILKAVHVFQRTSTSSCKKRKKLNANTRQPNVELHKTPAAHENSARDTAAVGSDIHGLSGLAFRSAKSAPSSLSSFCQETYGKMGGINSRRHPYALLRGLIENMPPDYVSLQKCGNICSVSTNLGPIDEVSEILEPSLGTENFDPGLVSLLKPVDPPEVFPLRRIKNNHSHLSLLATGVDSPSSNLSGETRSIGSSRNSFAECLFDD